MIRVAVVEDNQDLLDDVCFNLERNGFQILPCVNGAALDAAWAAFQPQVVVLDIGLPGEDGLSIAARLRSNHPALGIIMLTARTSLEDRIAGHGQGADNYLCKPVEMEELVAVVRARARGIQPQGALTSLWRFNLRQLTLYFPLGHQLELTAAESVLLNTILKSPGQQASRQELIRALGGNPLDFDPRRLEVTLSRLRQKIRHLCPEANPLRGLRNQGYAFLESAQLE